MKKKFTSGLILLLLYFPIVHAQTVKLTGAFNASFGIVADSKGNLFVTGKNNKIIKVTPQGKAELFAGGGRNGKDGKATQAGFNDSEGIVIDAEDNLYIADGPCIRKVTPDAVVTTIAGTRNAGIRDGNLQTSAFWNTENMAIDSKGNIYVSDYAQAGASTGEYCIRKISSDGFV
ncbi:MAG: hypothetical protein WAT34_01615, partial [Chitinophagaceae bacterium]